ncbi:signal peptidase [Paraburkholderia dipogonis]|uniref:Signal peptidase n=1 Tax=Paraburkholderia dipogonis TaxID=1211383 RepID=A0A4Y8MK59_9BURK|nr:TRAP transporter substrate-binding protein DctP [Paraburkholderia dipogonis]TFE37821.1 signal peptidase [Paraburkholderia dipogonis]
MKNLIEWKAESAYPQATIPGLGLAHFGEKLFSTSNARMSVTCGFEVGRPAAGLLEEVVAGDIQVADLYGGALSSVDPVFGLGSLPFLAATRDDSIELLSLARDLFKTKFHSMGARLLYVSPWPPTGLWSTKDIRVIGDFQSLRVRTYDETSATLVNGAGGEAVHLPIGDAIVGIEKRSVDAILSSGDGEAGRQFRKFLPFFFDIRYATPWSFLVVNSASYEALTPEMQMKVDLTSAETERAMWMLLEERMNANRIGMLTHGVRIRSALPSAVGDMLLEHARIEVAAWRSRVGGTADAVLSTYLER